MPERLGWPPKKEDLERLYLVEKLSAAKVAKIYDLKYKSPKVAESTVLYQLKRNGIERRDPAEHIRKVTEQMVDEWVRMYQAGESLKQIAGGLVDPVTVWNHLKRRDLTLRNRIEAQILAVTKYQRTPFSIDRIERAYLMGLRYGDLHVVKHGRAIRARVSTTHQAMADLFEMVFTPYGHVHRYPREAKLVGYEWTLEVDLDHTFEFLLSKATIDELRKFSPGETVAFLSGLFDAEGSVLLHKKGKRFSPEVAFTNSDKNLMGYLSDRLRLLGFSPHTAWRRQKGDRQGISGESEIGRIVIWKIFEVDRFVHLFRLKHGEKVAQAELVLEYLAASDKNTVVAKWKRLKMAIRTERQNFLDLAASLVSMGKNSKSRLEK